MVGLVTAERSPTHRIFSLSCGFQNLYDITHDTVIPVFVLTAHGERPSEQPLPDNGRLTEPMNDTAFTGQPDHGRRPSWRDSLESNTQDGGPGVLPARSASSAATRRARTVTSHRSRPGPSPNLADDDATDVTRNPRGVHTGPRPGRPPRLRGWMDDHPTRAAKREEREANMNTSDLDRDFLTTAVEQGYFKVPRQTSLVDLADEHDISDREASERLRTEIDAVLREHLEDEDATDSTDRD